jgi:SAM-dependent methyltransferase
MSEGYIHGATNAREVARLEKQADFTLGWSGGSLAFGASDRVLDLATGVGAVAARLLKRFPGLRLVGVDLSMPQLTAARANHAAIPVVRADGARLPFATATFDRVHCTWLLEHNASFSLTPTCPAVEAALARLNSEQVAAGGDPFVGQRVGAHFEAAGFSTVDVARPLLDGSPEHAVFRRIFIDEFAEIFDGLAEHRDQALFEAAASELRGIEARGGTFRYRPAVVTARRAS